MSFINHRTDLTASISVPAAHPSLWHRFVDAFVNGSARAREHAYADFLARNGGRVTDDLERQITSEFWHAEATTYLSRLYRDH